MAETMVENKVCSTCGEEARPGALFCYNCGSSVTQNVVESDIESSAGDAWFREELVDDETQKDEVEKSEVDAKDELIEEESTEEIKEETDLESKEIIAETEPEISENKTETSETPENQESAELKQKVRKKTKLRSASSLRNKGKFLRTGKTVIVWEERENAPNVLFLVVAIFLILLALGMFFLAMYLK